MADGSKGDGSKCDDGQGQRPSEVRKESAARLPTIASTTIAP